MDPSSPSTTNTSTNPPQVAPKQEEETLARGYWGSQEGNALVAAVNEVGEGNWANVQMKLVEKGFAKRALKGIDAHYTLLSQRTEAKGIALTGAVSLDPWTDEEGALMLALHQFIVEENAPLDLGYTPAVSWPRFSRFFPGRCALDLASHYSSIRKSEKRGSQAKRFERVKAKKDEAYETIKQGFAQKKSSPTLRTSSAAATKRASPTAEGGQSAQSGTSGNDQSTFSSAAQPADHFFSSPAQKAAALPPPLPSSSYLVAPSSTFILPRLVVTAATQTDFPSFPSPTSAPAEAALPARESSPSDCKNKGVESAGMKRVRAIFDEGRRVFKRFKEVFEQTEGSSEEEEEA